MKESKLITVAYGDGIGPEIMEAVLKILKEAEARIKIEVIEVGKTMYERGYSTGIPDDAWRSINESKILLKSPITTPQGGGYKSLNVTMRKRLGLFANVRPCVAYSPYIKTNHPNLNVVIVRENEEDLYAGIEYHQTQNIYHSIKMISRTGCEKIIRYAFEYAVKNDRKKVTCMSKDNIMKFSDGIFHKVFNEISKEYPNIANDHYIIDIGTAKLATDPSIFDVIVTSNLYGDIISDVVAEISGSVGMAGSANVGISCSMFEAIHGSAPDIAGKNIANPSGLLNGALMMLVHIGQADIAERIHNAWLRTLEDGMHTGDIYNESISKKKLGTNEFADAVIERLGKEPQNMSPIRYNKSNSKDNNDLYDISIKTFEKKTLVGVDITIDKNNLNLDQLIEDIKEICSSSSLNLKIISNKGLKIWPIDENNNPIISGDHWQLRFVPNISHKIINHQDIIFILKNISDKGYDFIRIENLYIFGDDSLGFSLSQGE